MTRSAVHPPPGAARTSVLAATLTVAMTSSVLLQAVFSALGPFLVEDLSLSRTQLGGLTTALYVTGSLLSPVAGPLVDRLGGRRPLIGLFAVTVAAVGVVSAAPTFLWLVVGALVGGIAVAIGNPVTNLLVAEHVPRRRQGIVTGLKQSGVQVGVFLGGSLMPPLAAVAGWRVAALTGLSMPLLGLVGLRACGRLDHADRHVTAAPAGGRHASPAGLMSLAIYGLGVGLGISAAGAYLPLFGVERLGLAPSIAGLLVAVLGAVGVVARIWWGRAADRHDRPPARTLALLGLISVASACLFPAAEALGTWLAWAGAVAAGASAAAWNAVGMLAIVRGAAAGTAGRASGIVLLWFYGGFVVGPPAFGQVVDRTGSYDLAWAGVAACYGVATVVAGIWAARGGRLGAAGDGAHG